VNGVRESVLEALAAAQGLDLRLLMPCLLLQVATLVLKGLAWRGLLISAYPGQRIPTLEILSAYSAGVAFNGLLPARGGEGLKVAFARLAMPFSNVPAIAGSLLGLLLVDGLIGAALLGVLVGSGYAPELPRPDLVPSVAPELLFAFSGPLAIGGLLVLRRIPFPRIVDFWRRFAKAAFLGLAALRSPRRYVHSVLPFQLLAWMARVGMVYFTLLAFHIQVSPWTAIFLVVFIGISTVIPIPGGGGSQQVLAVIALQETVSASKAISFSIGLQLGTTAVNLSVGLLATAILLRSYRSVKTLRSLWRSESETARRQRDVRSASRWPIGEP
jgi:uncharacterized membrane protein YbhN (UPF0104 family)